MSFSCAFPATGKPAPTATENDIGVDRFHGLISQIPLLQCPWAEVFEHNIHVRQQFEDNLLPLWRAQVQGDRLFIACLQEPEEGGVAAEKTPLAKFVSYP